MQGFFDRIKSKVEIIWPLEKMDYGQTEFGIHDPMATPWPLRRPHPFAKTRLLAPLWCAHHEMRHAGQIGLLRPVQEQASLGMRRFGEIGRQPWASTRR